MWYVNGEMFFFLKLTALPAMNQNPAAVEKVETESSLSGEQKKEKKKQVKRIAQIWYAAVN